MNTNEIQKKLDIFVNAVETSRESLGVIGGGETSGGRVPSTLDKQKSVMDSLTAAAVTNDLRFENGEGDSVTLTRLYRMEHQTWLRGENGDGYIECINLLNFRNIDLV